MKSLAGTLAAALGGPVQRPALLVYAGFDTPRYWTSMTTRSWSGQTWTARPLHVENLLVQAFRVSGTLVLDNADSQAGALVLAQGVKDRVIQLWGYDAAATGETAVVWLCTAVGGAARVSPHEVRIGLRHRTEFLRSPRTAVNAAAGFRQLLPADTVLRINGIDYRLERRS